MQKILKNEKGSISLFVLLAALFFLVVVTSVGISYKNKERSIDSKLEKIKMSYEKDAEQVYNEVISEEDWVYDNATQTVTKGNIKLKIGDYVNYSAVAGVDTTDTNNTTIKSNGTDNGYGDQVFDLTKYTGDNKWRVLGAKDGKVELISADIVPSNNSNQMYYLKGRTGFQNAETELTKIAGLYGHGTHATGARSVNVDDINKITGYNPNAEGIKNPTAEQIASGNKYGKNQLYEYGNKVTYSWNRISKIHCNKWS